MQRSLCVLFITALTLSARAQAPIERRPPTTPAASPLSLWPPAEAMRSRTGVFVSTHDGATTLCARPIFEPYRLACDGSYNPDSHIFDREEVSSIALAPKHFGILRGLPGALAKGGAAFVVLSAACGVDGGPPCKTPAIVGVSLLAGAVVAKIVQIHHQPPMPRPIYIAAVPPLHSGGGETRSLARPLEDVRPLQQ